VIRNLANWKINNKTIIEINQNLKNAKKSILGYFRVYSSNKKQRLLTFEHFLLKFSKIQLKSFELSIPVKNKSLNNCTSKIMTKTTL
jgi:hypothetical protein